MTPSSREVAARCLRDLWYARAVLTGGRHAAVRAAIMADLATAPEVSVCLLSGGAMEAPADAGGACAAGWLALPHPALGSLAAGRQPARVRHQHNRE